MMSKLAALALCFLVAMPAFAQANGGLVVGSQPSPVGVGSQYSFPANPSGVYKILPSHQLGMYYPTDTVQFTISTQSGNIPSGCKWYVYDMNENPVPLSGGGGSIEGDITGGSSSTTVTVPNPVTYGWYEFRLVLPTSVSLYGNTANCGAFMIVKNDSNFIAPAAYSTSTVGYPDAYSGSTATTSYQSPPLHALANCGPVRFSMLSDTVADAQACANNVATNLTYDATYGWTSYIADSVRPRKNFVSFRNWITDYTNSQTTAVAAVTAAATILGTTVVYEGANEPTISTYYTAYQAFYNAVHAGASGATVIGPCSISFNQPAQAGLTTFFSASPSIDAISLHPYNSFIPHDMWVGDQGMPWFISLLTTYGYSSKQRWDTESGNNGYWDNWGVNFHRAHLMQTVKNALQQERYGIPLERQSIFQDTQNGFWSFPQFYLTSGSEAASPGVAGMRFLTEMLRGSTFSSEINFSSAKDYIKGYQFSYSGGGYVTAFFTQLCPSLSITTSGGTAAYDVFGNSIAATGTYTLNDSPIYITSSSPLTISDVGNGLMSATNIATSATGSVPGQQQQVNVSLINDGLLTDPYYYGSNFLQSGSPYTDLTNFLNNGTATAGLNPGSQATITWGSAQTIKRVGLFFSDPFQSQNAPISFTVQANESGTWTTIYTFTNPTAYSQGITFAGSVNNWGTGAWMESPWDCAACFNIVLGSTISATALRVFEQPSWANCPDYFSWSRTTYPQGPQCMVLNDFRAYSN